MDECIDADPDFRRLSQPAEVFRRNRRAFLLHRRFSNAEQFLGFAGVYLVVCLLIYVFYFRGAHLAAAARTETTCTAVLCERATATVVWWEYSVAAAAAARNDSRVVQECPSLGEVRPCWYTTATGGGLSFDSYWRAMEGPLWAIALPSVLALGAFCVFVRLMHHPLHTADPDRDALVRLEEAEEKAALLKKHDDV